MRQNGFYWIKENEGEDFQVAEFHGYGGVWYCTGNTGSKQENDIFEICEQIIKKDLDFTNMNAYLTEMEHPLDRLNILGIIGHKICRSCGEILDELKYVCHCEND